MVLKSSVLGIAVLIVSHAFSQEIVQETYATPELLAARQDKQWRVPVAKPGPTRIPRVCASLRASFLEGMPGKTVVVHPEIDYWEIRFKGDTTASHVVLEFDSFPALAEEAAPTKQAGDGTLTLPCSHGRVHGEKLRFEPQPHKNTIGYWTVAEDSVTWPIVISQPDEFNVGLLQGAGEKGGGRAKVSLISDGNVIDSFAYDVEVTGHFQNFRWKHAGTLEAKEAGQYELRIEAVKIDKVALMDVRQVHLSPKR